jgi:hypothetical protein
VGQFGAAAVLDVGEDAAFGGVVDEFVVFGCDVGDQRARGFLDQFGDQPQRVLVVLAEADDRDVGELAARRLGDVSDVEQARDDGVTEFSYDLRARRGLVARWRRLGRLTV